MAVLNEGVQSAVSVEATEQMPDNDRLLYLYYRHQFPLFQKLYFSTGEQSKPVVNSSGVFNWWEDEYYPSSTALQGGGIVGGAATENVETKLVTNFLQPNDLLLVESTLQLVYVTTITTHTTISTMDGVTNISAAAAGNLRKVGTLDHEFSGMRAAVATKPVQNSNYLTKYNEAVAFSGSQEAGETWTDGTTFEEQIQKKIWEMKEFFENNFTFSPASGTKDISATVAGYTQNWRATWGKGALGSIVTNVIGYAIPDEDMWDSFFASLFSTGGSNHKTLYFGTNLGNNLAKIIKQKYAIDPKPVTEEYGVDLTQWRAFGGTIDLTWDVVMDGAFTDWGFVIDHEGTGKGKPVTFRYMRDDSKGSRKFRIIENVQTKDIDGRIDVLRAHVGVMYPVEKIHGIVRPNAA